MRIRRFLIVLTVVLLFGCTTHFGTLSVVSTHNFNSSKTYTKGANKVMGKDVTHMYIIFPDRLHPDISEAVKDALQNSCAEYLTDAELRQKFWFIPYIYGEAWFEVEGFPWYLEDEDRQNCLRQKQNALAIHSTGE